MSPKLSDRIERGCVGNSFGGLKKRGLSGFSPVHSWKNERSERPLDSVFSLHRLLLIPFNFFLLLTQDYPMPNDPRINPQQSYDMKIKMNQLRFLVENLMALHKQNQGFLEGYLYPSQKLLLNNDVQSAAFKIQVFYSLK